MTDKGAGDPGDTFRYPKPEALLQIQKDRPTVIEASAGTGKTYTLEHLIVDLLLTTAAGIENILVVTFTAKATSELTSRVRKKIRELAELQEEAPRSNEQPDDHYWLIDEDARHRLRKALTGFERAPISTIHSFCHSVLTEYAFLNRRLFEQDQVEEKRMFSQMFKEVLRTELSYQEAYQPYLTAWLESGKSVDALEALLFECHKAGSPLVPELEPDRIESALALLTQSSFDEESLKAAFREHGVHGNVANAVVKELPKLHAAAEAHQAEGLPGALAQLNTIDLSKTLERVRKASATDDLLGGFQIALEALEAGVVPLESAIAQVFLPPVRKRLVAFKREKGLYDFDDMIQVVADSLDGPRGDELIHALRARYHCALIDEFQDTDAVQWRIFRRVFFESEGKNPLFLVGDPKQAIYAFRGADVHVYLDARETVHEAGGQVLPLTECYRATPALIEAYNWILKQDHAQPLFTGDIRYQHPVDAGRPHLRLKAGDGTEAPPITLFQFHWPEGKVLLTEAKKALRSRIAEEIAQLRSHPLLLGEEGNEEHVTEDEIFVLTRSSRDGYEMGAALRELDVPFVYYKQEGLFQTPEAEHVRALLTAIEDPGDPSKRFHAWTTPFFGLQLDELLDCRDVPADHPLVSRLLEWKGLIEAKDYETAFTHILEESGILRRELFLKDNERALTNYAHIFEILLDEVSRNRCTLAELNRLLQSFIEQRALPVAGENADYQRLESDRKAVHIMTMHMAKGLEAGIVFLYGGFATNPGRNKVHVFYENGNRAAFAGALSKAPQGIQDSVHREEEEEDQRLLYVAMTRAKARLYLPYFPRKTYVNSRGEEKEDKILRDRSCYWQLNERLRVLAKSVGQVVPESLEKRRSLIHIVNVPVRPQPGEQMEKPTPPDLSDWRPAPGLVLYDPNDETFRKLEKNHAGFVITSYTRMKSVRGGYHAPIDTGADVTEEPEGVEEPEPSRDQLPPGRAAGVFLHEVLEAIDFETLKENPDFETWAANEDVRKLFQKLLRRHAFAYRYLTHSQKLVYTALTTPVPLNGGTPISGLYQVKQDLREVEFVYPYPESHHPKVADVIEQPFKIERGYVKGFVDFVFEHEGLTYFADWKSDSLPNWNDNVVNEHVQRNYELQAQLYSLALVKMLDLHDERSYTDKFGGLFYFFLRGMSADGNATGGVYFERPSWNQILDWEHELVGKTRL